MITPDDFTRVNNDVNGNPRYVLHFLKLANEYPAAVALSRSQGGKVYRGREYGGGIVFQCYSLPHLCDALNAIVKEAAHETDR